MRNNSKWEILLLVVLCLCLLGIGLILGLILGEKLGWVYKNQDLSSINLNISLTLPPEVREKEIADIRFNYNQFQPYRGFIITNDGPVTLYLTNFPFTNTLRGYF